MDLSGAGIVRKRFESRSFININRKILQQPIRILPFRKILEAIASHDDRELVVGIFFLEISEGIGSIRGFG